jgi:hypothetical protein
MRFAIQLLRACSKRPRRRCAAQKQALSADSEEKREPAIDIDTVVVDS